MKTAKDVAVHLIESYVLRGDTISQLRAGQMGSGSMDESASIGGFIFEEGKERASVRIPTDKILVEKVGGKVVNEIFSLEEIYKEITEGRIQKALF